MQNRVALGMGLMLLAAPTAHADVYSGATTDPVDGRVASTDVQSLSTSIDATAGTWTTTYQFRGRRTASTRANIYLSFAVPPGAFGNTQGGFVAIKLRGFQTRAELRDDALGGQVDTTQDTVTVTRAARALTVKVVDARIIGLTPTALNPSSISFHGRRQDKTESFPLTVTGS